MYICVLVMIKKLIDRTSYNNYSDQQIISEVLYGNTELFEVIVRRYNQRLFRILKSYITYDQDAKDVLQKTYIKTFNKLDSFNNDACFSTWLIRIAINEALMHLRKEKRHIKNENIDEIYSVHHSHNNNPEEELISIEKRQKIDNAIDKLPTEFKTVFIMRELESMSTKEVSKSLNITESNVKIRLKRAKEKLQFYLQNDQDLDQAYLFLGKNCDFIADSVMITILGTDSLFVSKPTQTYFYNSFFSFLKSYELKIKKLVS